MKDERRLSRWTVEFGIAMMALIVGAILWQYRLRYPFDDTFISFRYAEHVYNGDGLVWNVGGPHTEGFTNFLYVLLLAWCKVFTSDLLLGSQCIGVASVALTCVAIYRIGCHWSRSAGMLAATLYFVTPLVWFNAFSGMETSLFVLWIAWSFEEYFENRFAVAYGLSMLAMLTRPEGAFLALIFLVGSVTNGRLRKSLIAFLYAFAAPALIYVGWKYLYFGQLLPNSFYVKVLANSSLLPGLQYIRLFISSVFVLIVLTTPLVIKRVDTKALPLFLWTGLLVLFYLFVRPLEGLYDRFLIPVLPALVLLASIGLYQLIISRKWRFAVGAIAIVILHFGLSLISPRTQQSLAAHEDMWDRSLELMISAIQHLPHFDSLLIGYGDAGYVAYRTGMRHLDLFGLNDSRIARANSILAKRAVVLSEQPDILMLPVLPQKDSCWRLDENAHGAARDSNYAAVAMMRLFPSPILFLIDCRRPFADTLFQFFLHQTESTGSGLLAPPNCLDRN